MHDPLHTHRIAKQRVITFLVLTVLVTLTIEGLLAWLHPSSKGRSGAVYGLGVSWSPAIAAWLASRWNGRAFAESGWRWPEPRYLLLSYAVPLTYSLLAYGFAWISGLASFYDEAAFQKLSTEFGLHNLASGLALSALILVSATLGWLHACLPALGEEIGWRGYLVPELSKFLPFPKVALLSGSVWAVWHYPIIIFAGYNNGTPLWWSIPCFTIVLVAISFPLAWLRLRSGSVWTGMIFHASHNLFILELFNPLTKDTGMTKFIVSEFGIATVVTTVATAVVFGLIARRSGFEAKESKQL